MRTQPIASRDKLGQDAVLLLPPNPRLPTPSFVMHGWASCAVQQPAGRAELLLDSETAARGSSETKKGDEWAGRSKRPAL